jgi:tryptophan-rich sensory protein
MLSFLSISLLAALLLVPYILWSSFAAVLNYSISKLNK